MDEEEGGEEQRWMGALMVLPLEILQHFMSYLRIREICWALPSLNKQWQALLSDHALLVPLLSSMNTGTVNSRMWKELLGRFLDKTLTEDGICRARMRHVFQTIDNWKKGTCGRVRLRVESPPQAVLLDEEHNFLYAGLHNGILRRYSLNNLSECIEAKRHAEWVRGIERYKDTLFTCSNDFSVKAWIQEDNQLTEVGSLTAHSSIVRGIHVSPDGTNLLSCSNDSNINLVDINTMTLIRKYTGHQTMVRGSRFSSTDDGRTFFSGSEDGTWKRWDAASGKSVASYNCGIDGGVWSLRESDGIIALGLGSSTPERSNVQLWSARTGTVQCHLERTRKTIFTLALDYNRLIIGTSGGMSTWSNVSNLHNTDQKPDYGTTTQYSKAEDSVFHSIGIILSISMSAIRVASGSDDQTIVVSDFGPRAM